MSGWNMVCGILLALATMPYLTHLKTEDFAQGKTYITGCENIANTFALASVCLAFAGLYVNYFADVKLQLVTAGLCSALVAAGWRYQAAKIYEHREDSKVAEKMVAALENFGKQIKTLFTADRPPGPTD
jgi:hypothetical protein